MENNYKEIIVKLIQNHRKYPGLEAILDDIVLDVQERAKVVMNNVTNIDIVESYLKKIVSTSIITVPKKMNYNINTNHRIITQNNILPEILDENPTTDTEKDSEEFYNEEQVVEKSNENDNNLSVDSKPESILEITCENDLKTENTKVSDIDISLVDKMINGASIPTKESELEEFSDTDYTILDEIDSLNIDNPEQMVAEISDKEEHLEFYETEIQDQNEIISVNEELNQENISNEELDKEEFIEIEGLDVLYGPEINSDIEDFESNDIDNFEEFENLNALEEENDNSSYYSIFNSETIDIIVEQGEIISLLKNLDNKKPDFEILKIFNLKYKENLSVEEIAKTLNKEVDFVLESLSEIIDIVKE